jgi:hypothetical protein
MLDRRERVADREEALRLIADARAGDIWTSLPGIIQAFYPQTMTVDVQPAINGVRQQSDGSWVRLQMPVIPDVPVYFPGGGGVTLTFPIAKGDECLIVFSARCIDSWWDRGGVQDQFELRMHDLSDAIALVGVRSRPRAFSPSTTCARVTTDDGQTYFEFDPAAKKVNVLASGGINLNGLAIDQNGNVSAPGTIAAQKDITTQTNVTAQQTVTGNADVKTGSISLKTHTHTDPQGGVTGPPQ